MIGNQPGTVTFQFSRPDFASQTWMNRIISEGICKETRSEICHVDLVTPQGTLIGAHIGDGIQERPADYQKWGLRLRVTLPASPDQASTLMGYAHRMIGTKYDVKDILGIALGDADLHDANRMICSSFAATAVTRAGLAVVDKDLWQVSPEELRLVLAARTGAQRERIVGQ